MESGDGPRGAATGSDNGGHPEPPAPTATRPARSAIRLREGGGHGRADGLTRHPATPPSRRM
ncbi:hypothetical protein ATKI12_7012 [Kitasatospora sp. Ki12]